MSTSRYSEAASRALGRGGMGSVLAVRDPLLGREVAVKRLEVGDEAGFLREARIAARLDHPAIVTLFDLVRDEAGVLCAVMRLIDGESLADRLRRCLGLEERLALVPRFLQVCQAVAYANRRGVVHLDLKPHNVMLGTEGQLSVVDWGLAQELPRDATGFLPVAAPGSSPAYGSPEQARGEPVGTAADAWGLGAILFELLTGRPPWLAESPSLTMRQAQESRPPRVQALEPAAPPGLVAICEKALAVEQGQRYPSAIELTADLEAWLQGRATSARHRRPGEALRDFVRRHPWPVGATAAAVLLVSVVSLVAAQRVRTERDEARALSRVVARAASRGIEPHPDNEPLLAAFVEAEERYGEHLGEARVTDDVVDLAIARERLCRLRQRLGNTVGARADCERALSLAKEAVAVAPDDRHVQQALVGTLMTLGSIAALDGRVDEELAWRTRALEALAAAPESVRRSAAPAWLELRALAVTQWLYLATDGSHVTPQRRAEVQTLAEQLEREGARSARRSTVFLLSWLLGDAWARGALDEARGLAGRVDAACERLLADAPTVEARGLAVYALLVSGLVASWSGDEPLAQRRWRRALDQSALSLDTPGALPVLAERARVLLASGEVAPALELLRQTRAQGMAAPSAEALAALALGEVVPPLADPAEDFAHAVAGALAALRAEDLATARRHLERARSMRPGLELLIGPGALGRLAARQPMPVRPSVEAFAKAYDAATARGDAEGQRAALEALRDAVSR